MSLLQLIGDPPPDEISRIYGPGGAPAYVFGPDAAVGQPAIAHFSNPFYRQFSLLFHVKPDSAKPAVLFSITDHFQKFMYVGVKLSAVERGRQRLLFFYTEPDSDASYQAASFDLPPLVGTWTRFSLAVTDDQVNTSCF